jgi:predicted NBD/HSP70 family sugar kinase
VSTRGPTVTGSLGALRELNRLRVVDALRHEGVASRAELARLTGLSRTTVATLVNELQANGLVVERPDAERPAPGKGRPPVQLRLNPAAGAAVGVAYGHRHVRVAVADLSSRVLGERELKLDVDRDATAALDSAAELLDGLLDDVGVERRQLVGAGLGVPGPIDRRTGTVGSVILPGWARVEPGAELSARLGVHVEVENDANLGGLGEVLFGAARGLEDVVYLKVSSGIGAGLVLRGRLYRGATGRAGEIGHVRARPHGTVCRCGNRGCLETVASAPAVVESLAASYGPGLRVRGVLRLVADGDATAIAVVRDAGREIGRALADLCDLLNPEAIVVGGDLSGAGETFLEAIREVIDRRTLPATAGPVDVRAGTLGERAEVLGALALVTGDTERLRSAGLVALHGVE